MEARIQASGRKKRIETGKVIVYLILCLWALTTIFPMLWVTVNSFQESGQILINSFRIPAQPYLKNYVDAISEGQIGSGFLNSFIISGSVVVLCIAIGGFAAYRLSRFRFRGNAFIQIILYISMLIPQYATLVPVYMILKNLGVLNGYLSLILPHTAQFLPFTVTVLITFMKTIPHEIEEAATIDGCSAIKTYLHVIFPISLPSFSTAAIFVFLWSYNDLLTSLVYISNPKLKPICFMIANTSSVYGTNYGMMMAALVITILPVLILYLILQENVIKGMTSGAIKG